MLMNAKRPVIVSVFVLLCVSLLAAPLAAEVDSSTTVSVTTSTIPEAQVSLAQSWTFPFLQGEGALTGGNNVKLSATAEVTPISIFGVGRVTWTPIAFFQVIAGGRVGSGWTLDLFGGTLKGLGINRPNADGTTTLVASAFDGVIWNALTAGVIQFDFAAVKPGDWNHIVFQSQHEIRYDGYSAASNSESWYTANDGGENRNGFSYYGNFLLGYQMPIFFDTVGILAEVNKHLYGKDGGDVWGDDIDLWTFSVLGNFTVNDWLGIAVLAQFDTHRNFTDATKGREFYQDRVLVDSGAKQHLEFYRAAVIATFKLR
jgi:hypothetical protein